MKGVIYILSQRGNERRGAKQPISVVAVHFDRQAVEFGSLAKVRSVCDVPYLPSTCGLSGNVTDYMVFVLRTFQCNKRQYNPMYLGWFVDVLLVQQIFEFD